MRWSRAGRWRAARAATIVECVLSLLVVSVMLTASLRVAASSRQTVATAQQRATAAWLADQMLAEVLGKAYAEPDGGGLLGIDLGELATQKANFDDVDDYDDWSESPPQGANGTALAGLTRWTREVSVASVNREAPSMVMPGEDTGVKLVTVVVRWRGTELARSTGVKADAPGPGGP